MFRMMSVTSSMTPGSELNSCSAPFRRMCVTAAPSSELSRIRRRLLPTVVPNPRSNGSAENLPYVSVETFSSRVTRDGSSSPRHRILMVAPCDPAELREVPVPSVGDHLYSHLVGDHLIVVGSMR